MLALVDRDLVSRRCPATAGRRRVAEIVVSSHSEFACAKFEAASQSGYENICRHPARARILRVGVRYGPE
jgi:hypothetical protein